MKKRFAIILGSILAVAIVISVCALSLGDDISFFESLGIISKTRNDDTIVAEYNGFKVTQAMIDTQRSATDLSGDDVQPDANMKDDSDRAIIDRLITGRMLTDEAEARGVAATQEEMGENLATLKGAYEQYDDVKHMIDDYCKGASISIDEYWKQVYDQSYGRISRTNLKIALCKEYCGEIGYTGDYEDKMQTEEFENRYNEYKTNLLNSHKSDIQYYGK
jgi:hypothetical protein